MSTTFTNVSVMFQTLPLGVKAKYSYHPIKRHCIVLSTGYIGKTGKQVSKVFGELKEKLESALKIPYQELIDFEITLFYDEDVLPDLELDFIPQATIQLVTAKN